MSAKRKRHSAEFKAKVALDAVRGTKTINEIASEYGVHPTQIGQWKKQLQAGVREVFSGRHAKNAVREEVLTAGLYEEIGRLKMELEWLKKKSIGLR